MRQITQTGSLHDIALTQTLPPALQYDAKMTSLAEALAALLQCNAALIVKTDGIYYRIEELEEKMLDILAADLHADWYDYNGTLQQKRAVIKNNVAIHRKMGTVAGLKTAIASVMGTAELQEWFQYGGNPYYFRVTIDAADMTGTEIFEKLLKAISIYKPVRARLESVAAKLETDSSFGIGIASQLQIKQSAEMDAFDVEDVTWYLDENSNILIDESGNVICEEVPYDT